MKKIIAILILLGSLSFSLLANIPASERQALIDLYNSTNGDNWTNKTNWLGAPGTEGTWYGVTLDGINTSVVSLVLSENNLLGSLPASLGNLLKLEELQLWRNQLTGSIPTSLGNLSNLIQLDLSINQLTGAIPANFGNMTLLQQCNLGDNFLSGAIPVELGNAKNLQQLFLYANQLSGGIPASLGNLPMLYWLDLGFNKLSGTIPLALGNASSLQRISLDFNQLTGSIPEQLGGLTDLKSLYLRNNYLSGSIPAGIGNLPNLWILELSKNSLSGPIPAELGNLYNLMEIELWGNLLAGEIPATLTGLVNLDPFGNTGATDMGYNALFAIDADLIGFLNEKDPDWATTQTIAPANVKATLQTATSIRLSWTPILYSRDSGGYIVYASKTSCGPYAAIGTSGSKSYSSFLAGGLASNTKYFFVVSAFTKPNRYNNNTVLSAYSVEVSFSTPPVLAWKIGTKYKVNDLVLYKTQTWQCTYAHTAQVDWYPGAPGLWFWKKI